MHVSDQMFHGRQIHSVGTDKFILQISKYLQIYVHFCDVLTYLYVTPIAKRKGINYAQNLFKKTPIDIVRLTISELTDLESALVKIEYVIYTSRQFNYEGNKRCPC